MSAFMQGLTAGSNVAAGWMDTYERSRKRVEEERKRAEAEALKARRAGITTAQAEDSGMRYSAEQGAELERAAQSGQYNVVYDEGLQAYTVTPKPVKAPPVDPMDGAVPPVGLGDPYTPPPAQPQTAMYAPAQRYGTFMGQEYEGEMTPARLQGLRNRAMLDTVEDPFERQRLQLTQMQTEELQGKREREAATRAAQAQLSEMYARGETPDAAAIMSLAGSGADSAALMQTAAAALELDDKQIKASTNKLIADINKASTSPEKFNEVLRQFDPDPNDDKVPTLRTNRDGTLQVFIGDQPMTQKFRDTKDMSALSQLAGFYKDQITGDRMGTAVQMATLEKLRAQTAAANRTSPGEKSLAQKVADAEKVLGRKLTDAEKAVMVGVQGRDRAPSAADLNARAKMYMESDPDLTAEQALAMAQNDLGGGLGSRTPLPPGQVPGESPWAPRTAPTPTSAAPAATQTAAPPPVGLSRGQVGQAVAQQQGSVQAETRVRRAAIAEFEADPRVKQAYDAVRQLRRAGESARANNIEIQINAQRDRFINSKVGGQ